MKLIFFSVASIAFSWVAHAQSPAPAPVKNGSVKANASAFTDYKRFNPKEPMADWRKANETVEALEGHMGHVRGAPKPKLKTEMKK